MSAKVGFLMVVSGVGIVIGLFLKLIVQPFIEEGHYFHNYFPSTELVLGIPIIIGVVLFIFFGTYITWELKREDGEQNSIPT